MRDLIERIEADRDTGSVGFRRSLPARAARHAEPARPLPEPLRIALAGDGIDRLYTHQAEAIDAVRDGRDVMTVTPTASGKSLVYFLPTLENHAAGRGGRALYIYPYKALEQDQLQAFRRLAAAAAAAGGGDPARAVIYDGDTPQADRKKIRAHPPDVLITNPDMLHLGILAYHPGWKEFLARLELVVIDELHVYRGIFGAHFHHVVHRLRRICRHYGSDPRFVVCSATVAHPERLGETVIGRPFHVVSESGSPQAPRHFLFVHPRTSPYVAATRILAAAVESDHRTIAFTKARKITELIHSWLRQGHPDIAARVGSYRAGYLPEERRGIEARLASGEMMGVVSTSALELGVDIGGLDVCVLVGYPGSMMSSWQRIGRVGRQDRDSLIVLVGMPDALDQYFLSNPSEFFERGFEEVVLDPANPEIAGSHLVCAAAELPITAADRDIYRDDVFGMIPALVGDGRLLADAKRAQWYSLRRRPQRGVHLRSIGASYSIHDLSRDGRVIGSVDGARAFHECHPGAVYLHQGRQWEVKRLEVEERRIEARPAEVDYYTEVLAEKETEVLEVIEAARTGRFEVKLGRLKVTEKILEYCKRRIFGQDRLGYFPLQLPPTHFETVGLWLELPESLRFAVETGELHFMGGIHAVEHAAISLFPLFAICDRSDIGGISYPHHPQLKCPAIFIYDGYPGGIGLAARGFREIDRLLERTRTLIRGCPCEAGCPSCIHSPKCGNGNRPLDKRAALMILDHLTGEGETEKVAVPAQISPAAPMDVPAVFVPPPAAARVDAAVPAGPPRRMFFDLETQRSAADVGGWHRADRMGLAVGVIYDEGKNRYESFYEDGAERLLERLAEADVVVGFNLKRFDYVVLRGYTDIDLSRLPTLDMLEEIKNRIGFRVSLNRLAGATLGEEKSADGLQSLRWFKEGRLDLVEEYCRRDVMVTRKLWEFGRDNGHLLFQDGPDRTVRIPVEW